MSVVYFAKTNLISEDIYTVYKDYGERIGALKSIRDAVTACLRSQPDLEENFEYVEDNVTYAKSIKYEIIIFPSEDPYHIEGTMYRTSAVYLHILDNEELKPFSVDNTESIRFYYDAEKEMVGFHTTHRFKHINFIYVFEKIINNYMKNHEKSYRFQVCLYTEGYDVAGIKEELKKLGNVKLLTVTYRPPNPDDELLKEIRKNGEEELRRMDQANVTSIVNTFESTGDNGINVDSELIDEQLNVAQSIHSKLDSTQATQKGYVQVKATSKDGVSFTTSEKSKPVTGTILNLNQLATACKEMFNRMKEKG